MKLPALHTSLLLPPHLGLQVRKKCPSLLQSEQAGMRLPAPRLVKILARDSSLLLQH